LQRPDIEQRRALPDPERTALPKLAQCAFRATFQAGTTPDQAEAFAAQLQELCPAMYFQWFDFEMEQPLYERDENGWAILD
jgi:hypothetical protein